MSLTALYRWLAVRATPGVLALGGLLWIASALGVVALQRRVETLSGGLRVPDVDPFYTPAELYAVFENFGPPARRAFLEFAIYDIYYPFVAYGVAALVLVSLSRSVIHTHPRLVWGLAVPVAGLVVELLEQACFLGVLALLPAHAPVLAFAAALLTRLKFGLILVLLAFLGGVAVWRAALLARRASRRRG